jgi:hypothetical protein
MAMARTSRQTMYERHCRTASACSSRRVTGRLSNVGESRQVLLDGESAKARMIEKRGGELLTVFM